MLLSLPDGVEDVQIAADAAAFGLSPSPLSPWFDETLPVRSGLLLGVTTAPESQLADAVSRIRRLVEPHLGGGTVTS